MSLLLFITKNISLSRLTNKLTEQPSKKTTKFRNRNHFGFRQKINYFPNKWAYRVPLCLTHERPRLNDFRCSNFFPLVYHIIGKVGSVQSSSGIIRSYPKLWIVKYGKQDWCLWLWPPHFLTNPDSTNFWY